MAQLENLIIQGLVMFNDRLNNLKISPIIIAFFSVLKGCVPKYKSTWLIPFKYCWDKFWFIMIAAPHAISDVLNLLSYHAYVGDVFVKMI